MNNAANTTETRALLTSAQAAWHAGNNAGKGFAVFSDGEDSADSTTFDDSMDDALDAGWSVVSLRLTASGVAILRTPGGRLVAVGEANGAWGVYL